VELSHPATEDAGGQNAVAFDSRVFLETQARRGGLCGHLWHESRVYADPPETDFLGGRLGGVRVSQTMQNPSGLVEALAVRVTSLKVQEQPSSALRGLLETIIAPFPSILDFSTPSQSEHSLDAERLCQ